MLKLETFIEADNFAEEFVNGLKDLHIDADRKDEPQTCDDCIWTVCNYNKAFEDEPQTDCDGCKHYADEYTADACYECKRSYTDGYVPQTERSSE